MSISRRRYLTLVGGAATAGLAGCGTGGSVERTTYDAPTASVPTSAEEFLSNVSNYDGHALDLTDRDEVEVAVGTRANGGYFGYSPVAIRLSTGTTVRWTWTGRGNAHNVKAKNGPFDSGVATASSDATFEYTFEESGVYPYFCTPHRASGMKGVVIVE